MFNQIKNQFAEFVLSKPRKAILDFETPLVRLETLSKKLNIELWMKRDDLAGPSFGGNKARQLEYYFCLLYTSPSPRDGLLSRMPSSA